MRALILVSFMFILVSSCLAATPPQQPQHGPGGSEYAHRSVKISSVGEDALKCWIFEPADPVPSQAPIVLFNHGWGGVNPKSYGAWIEHLVRKGNIVLYPLYQSEDSLRYPVEKFTPNAISAVRTAIEQLEGKKHVKAELDKFAIIGHSMGGVIAANIAALWQTSGLPKPRALMVVEPGKTWAKSDKVKIKLEDLSVISSDILLLAIVGDKDRIVQDTDAKRIFYESKNVPPANKDFVILQSDDRGSPALLASHFAPTASMEKYNLNTKGTKAETDSSSLRGMIRNRLQERMQSQHDQNGEGDQSESLNAQATADALDYYGLWKLFDGLYSAAFYGTNREFALGNTPQQRFMGLWSDGAAVKELKVTDAP